MWSLGFLLSKAKEERTTSRDGEERRVKRESFFFFLRSSLRYPSAKLQVSGWRNWERRTLGPGPDRGFKKPKNNLIHPGHTPWHQGEIIHLCQEELWGAPASFYWTLWKHEKWGRWCRVTTMCSLSLVDVVCWMDAGSQMKRKSFNTAPSGHWVVLTLNVTTFKNPWVPSGHRRVNKTVANTVGLDQNTHTHTILTSVNTVSSRWHHLFICSYCKGRFRISRLFALEFDGVEITTSTNIATLTCGVNLISVSPCVTLSTFFPFIHVSKFRFFKWFQCWYFCDTDQIIEVICLPNKNSIPWPVEWRTKWNNDCILIPQAFLIQPICASKKKYPLDSSPMAIKQSKPWSETTGVGWRTIKKINIISLLCASASQGVHQSVACMFSDLNTDSLGVRQNNVSPDGSCYETLCSHNWIVYAQIASLLLPSLWLMGGKAALRMIGMIFHVDSLPSTSFHSTTWAKLQFIKCALL